MKTYGQETADRESARPGASQHQLGTAIDFGSITDAFARTRAGKWLFAHAGEYGFSLSYPQGYEGITGYRYESWHYRYVTKAGVLLQRKYFGDIQQYLMEFLDQNRPSLEASGGKRAADPAIPRGALPYNWARNSTRPNRKRIPAPPISMILRITESRSSWPPATARTTPRLARMTMAPVTLMVTPMPREMETTDSMLTPSMCRESAKRITATAPGHGITPAGTAIPTRLRIVTPPLPVRRMKVMVMGGPPDPADQHEGPKHRDDPEGDKLDVVVGLLDADGKKPPDHVVQDEDHSERRQGMHYRDEVPDHDAVPKLRIVGKEKRGDDRLAVAGPGRVEHSVDQ